MNTGDIFNKAITTQKLDGQAVTTGKLAGQAVTTGKLASQAVTSGKLAADSVGTGKIKADAVTSAKIKDGTIKLQDLNSTIPTQITTAQTTADTANTAATAAQTTADTANTAAGAAQATADTASTNATAAQTTATNAETTANAAQTTADGLQTQVTSAVNTANSAQTTATSAQTTANSLSSQVSTHISGSESRLTALESAQEILVDDRADGTYILSAETLPLDGVVNFGIRIRGDGLINLAGTITEIELGGIPGTQIFGSPFTSQLLEYQWPRGSFKPGASYLLKVFDRGLTQIGASNISEFEYHFEGQSKINKIQITNGGDGNDIEDLLTSCTTTSTGELQCENVNIERKITAIEMEDIALYAIAFLKASYPRKFQDRYTLDTLAEEPIDLLEIIGAKRGCLRKGGVDHNKVAEILLNDIRSQKLGQITLESPADIPKSDIDTENSEQD